MVMSGVASTAAIRNGSWSDSRPLPRGRPGTRAAGVPSRAARSVQRIAELALTAKRAAAARRDMPPPTAAVTRTRMSCE